MLRRKKGMGMIGRIGKAVGALLLAVMLAGTALAQGGLSALARIDGAGSRLWADGDMLALELVLSQPVPWRVRFLAEPPRLVLDFREVDFAGLDAARLKAGAPGQVTDLRAVPATLRHARRQGTVEQEAARRREQARGRGHHQAAKERAPVFIAHQGEESGAAPVEGGVV